MGVVGILVAILGCSAARLKNPFFAIPYGILTFIGGIIFLFVALMGLTMST